MPEVFECVSLQAVWCSSSSSYTLPGCYHSLMDINRIYGHHITSALVFKLLPQPGDLSSVISLQHSISSLRSLVRQRCDLMESQARSDRIKFFEELRCDNFLHNKTAFISSSLGRSKRCIVLNRAM